VGKTDAAGERGEIERKQDRAALSFVSVEFGEAHERLDDPIDRLTVEEHFDHRVGVIEALREPPEQTNGDLAVILHEVGERSRVELEQLRVLRNDRGRRAWLADENRHLTEELARADVADDLLAFFELAHESNTAALDDEHRVGFFAVSEDDGSRGKGASDALGTVLFGHEAARVSWTRRSGQKPYSSVDFPAERPVGVAHREMTHDAARSDRIDVHDPLFPTAPDSVGSKDIRLVIAKGDSMARTFYEPDSLEEELAIMEERDEVEEGMPTISLDTRISELGLRPASILGLRASVGDALRTMQRDSVSAVVVVEEGRLVGIFTERDVVTRVAGSPRDPDGIPLVERMTRDPESLRPEDAIAYVVSRMLVGGYRHVPIVDESGVPVHVISMRDLMEHLLDPAERRISTLPPEPFHGESRIDVGYG